MPQTISPTTRQRSQRARAAVIAYRKAADTNETKDATLLTDLLADLMHLAGSCRGVDFNYALDMARSHYTTEFLREALTPSMQDDARTAIWAAGD